MADLPKYHLGPQLAPALLRPIRTGLGEYVARTGHYLERLHLVGEADRQLLAAANRILAEAAQALDALTAKEQSA